MHCNPFAFHPKHDVKKLSLLGVSLLFCDKQTSLQKLAHFLHVCKMSSLMCIVIKFIRVHWSLQLCSNLSRTTNKAQKKIPLEPTSAFFQGFICNCLSYYITARITLICMSSLKLSMNQRSNPLLTPHHQRRVKLPVNSTGRFFKRSLF